MSRPPRSARLRAHAVGFATSLAGLGLGGVPAPAPAGASAADAWVADHAPDAETRLVVAR